MAGYLLVICVLLLGGVIATVGDRLGYKVGKARLSLFNLRPRNTAVLITILTGGVISASTLGILFATSDSLRTGLFELDKIQKKLADARSELNQALKDKEVIEDERDQAKRDRVAAQQQLDRINRFLVEAQVKQSATSSALKSVLDRADGLRQELDRLESERQALITQRNQVRQQINERDREVQRQNTVITQGRARLTDLESQQQFLNGEILKLERDLVLLRERRVVLARGEVLAAQLLKVNTLQDAKTVVNGLLSQANSIAQSKTRPGSGDNNPPVIQIPQAEVDRLIQTLSDGQPYVVRVLSASNYITGEAPVLVFLDVSLNRILFPGGQVIASTSADPTKMTPGDLRDRINLLLSAAQFRAQQAGIVNDNIEVPIDDLVRFLGTVVTYNRPLILQAIAAEPTYTVGPLRLEFLALDHDQILFRSKPTPVPRL